MDNVTKFVTAVRNLKADTEMSFDGTGVTTESQFNQVRWKTGEDSNGKIVTTISKIKKQSFEIWIIPHTLKLTNLNNLKKNAIVNVEIDILSKYVKKYLNAKN